MKEKDCNNQKQRKNSKRIVCFSREGLLISSYESPTFAQKQTGISFSNIIGVLKKRNKTAGNLIWMYEEEYLKSTEKDIGDLINFAKKDTFKINIKKRIRKKPFKKVYQYLTTGEFVKEYTSSIEAGFTLKINPQSIRKCCKNLLKTSGHYVWRYYYAENIIPISSNKNNELKQ